MQKILPLFLLLVLLFSYSSANDFEDVKKITLKKDEQTKILVKYDTYKRVLAFRWTLYVNDGLIVFHSYDKRVAQTILYLNTRNQSFKVYLKEKGSEPYEPPYFLVKFKDFDFEKNEAIFELFLSDRDTLVEIKYLKNEKKK